MSTCPKRALILALLLSHFIISEALADDLELTVSAGDYRISKRASGYSVVTVDGFGALTTPGKPQLPAKTFMIALPPGAKVRRVNVTGNGPVHIEGTYRVMPAKLTIRGDFAEDGIQVGDLQRAQQEWQENYDATYRQDNPYPEEVGSFVGQGQWRKYTYARVRLHPFQYQPSSGRLVFYPSATVSIDYALPEPQSEQWQQAQRLLSDNVLEDVISQSLVNYEEAQAWYQSGYYEAAQTNGSDKFDYVIIVDNERMITIVEPLKKWKEKIGYRVKVVTLDYIFSHYTGGDEAEQIWNFLHNNYSGENWGIRYVLLVGDVNVLPVRFLFPSDLAWPYASDYYYAKLSISTWDVDGDNRFGEFHDDKFDPAADVLVGRIPHNEASVVYNICMNIIDFEQDIGSWKRKALLPMGMMDYVTSTDKTDCAVLSEYLKTHVFDPHGWSYTTLYEKNPISPSTYACDQPLSEQNFIGALGPKTQGLVNISAHGSPGGFSSQVWFQDIDNNGVHDPDTELTWNGFSGINNIPANLDSVAFLCGCSTGPPCRPQPWPVVSSWQIIRQPLRNLGRAYLINGAPAVIASTAGGDYCHNWKKPQDGNWQSLNFYFCDHLINKDKKVGDAFFDAQLQYANDHQLQRGIRVFGLLGDPSLTLKGIEDRPGGTDVLIHEGFCYRFAADNADNGHMYVAARRTPIDQPGQINVYKSTDHGQSWNTWATVWHDHGVFDVALVVGEWKSGGIHDKRLNLFFTTTAGCLWVARIDLNNPLNQSLYCIACDPGEATFLSAARDPKPMPSNFNLYVAWTVSTSSHAQVRVARSTDNGKSWIDYFTYNDYERPDIDAGPNGHVYLTTRYIGSPDHVAIKRSTDGGVSWNGWTNLTAGDGANQLDGHWDPAVGASTDPSFPSVWVVYDYVRHGPQIPHVVDLRCAYSKDKGSTWNKNQILSADQHAKEAFADMAGYRAAPNRWVNIAYRYLPDNVWSANVIWRHSSGSLPSNWSAQRIVNDFKSQPLSGPRVVYSPGAGPGSGVVYGGQHGTDIQNLYFSAPWLTSATSAAGGAGKMDSGTSAPHSSIQNNASVASFSNLNDGWAAAKSHDALGNPVNTLRGPDTLATSGEISLDNRKNHLAPKDERQHIYTIQTSKSSVSEGPAFAAQGIYRETQSDIPAAWMEMGELENAFTVSSLLRARDGSLYAAAAISIDETRNEGAVFRAAEDGQRWERLGPLEFCWSLTCLFQSNDGSLFAGGLMLEADQAYGVVYRSTNAGDTWDTVLAFPDGIVYDLMQAANRHLYAATGWNGLIFKSEDGGRGWFPLAGLGENVHIYSIMQATNGRFFATLERPDGGQIMRSTDGGERWFPAEGLGNVIAVYDLLESNGRLYAAARGEDMGWIYQSDLAGLAWRRTAELPDADIEAVRCLTQGPQGEIFAGGQMMLGPSFTKVFVMPPGAKRWEAFGGMLDLATTVNTMLVTADMVYVGSGHIYGNVYKCALRVTECFPSTHPAYEDWVRLGKPDCWCRPYQCDGDVDGATETIFKYRVYGKDLAAVVENWKKKADDPTWNPCADIDHKAETIFKYRVYGKDLATVVANWKKKDAQLSGNCPRPE